WCVLSQAVTYNDSMRELLITKRSVDDIALAGLFVIGATRTTTPRFAAYVVVRHHKRVLVDHHALEACVRTHVFTDGFPQEAGVAPGGERIEHHPEPLPWA